MGIFWGEKVERACHKPRRDLHDCIYQSDCVKKDGMSPRHCLKEKKDFPEECEKYAVLLFECKHSLLDMRQRFRGRKGDRDKEKPLEE